MVAVNIREFAHHLSKHLKSIKAGGRIVIMERNKPIAELIPHNPHPALQLWIGRMDEVRFLKGAGRCTEFLPTERLNTTVQRLDVLQLRFP